MEYTEKDVKFMRVAKTFAEEFVTCLSRKIGIVIVKRGRVVSQGVNGPPSGVLHLEDRYVKVDDETAIFGKGWFYSEFLEKWVRTLDEHGKYIDIHGAIGIQERVYVLSADLNNSDNVDKQRVVKFKDSNDLKGEVVEVIDEPTCPRKILKGYQSGSNLELCGCQHGEANSILNAARNGIDIAETSMYCYCGLPCVGCTGAILNSGISTVYYLDHHPDYSFQSRAMFAEAGVKVIEIPQSVVDGKEPSLSEPDPESSPELASCCS